MLIASHNRQPPSSGQLSLGEKTQNAIVLMAVRSALKKAPPLNAAWCDASFASPGPKRGVPSAGDAERGARRAARGARRDEPR